MEKILIQIFNEVKEMRRDINELKQGQYRLERGLNEIKIGQNRLEFGQEKLQENHVYSLNTEKIC
ncbi:hypothetical protein V7138_07405 [Bacillus sp. JJ1533]|uniref:hypothetical protein n=1 Tax=Bacillus sp. JJ1533 TaxID=3122959 RepID=UPI002FFE716E